MRSNLILCCLVTALAIPSMSGCAIYRHYSRPELWGLSFTESWDYDLLRHSGRSHAEARRIIRERKGEPYLSPDDDLLQPTMIDAEGTPE